MRSAPYYEIGYAGVVQRGWLVLVTACWSAGPAPTSSSSAPTTSALGSTPAPPPSVSPPRPPRAALDGQLRVQAEVACGGALLPDDYQPPPLAPVAGVRLQVVAGDRYGAGTPVTEVTTDRDGRFAAPLPQSRYCVVRAGRGPKPTQGSQHTALACLVERWERCDAVVDVPVKVPVAIDIYEPCSWSICYHGPAPP